LSDEDVKNGNQSFTSSSQSNGIEEKPPPINIYDVPNKVVNFLLELQLFLIEVYNKRINFNFFLVAESGI